MMVTICTSTTNRASGYPDEAINPANALHMVPFTLRNRRHLKQVQIARQYEKTSSSDTWMQQLLS